MNFTSPDLKYGISRLKMSFELSSIFLTPPRDLSSSIYTVSPPSSMTASMISCTLPSRSPRYCVPLNNALMFSSISISSLSLAGTDPLSIRCDMPLAIVVFPTPLPPTSRTLFLRFLQSILIALSISSFRPTMAGSGFTGVKYFDSLSSGATSCESLIAISELRNSGTLQSNDFSM